MTERIECTNAGCMNRILPATKVRTGGLCMPCVKKMEREEKQRYIDEHRKDIDPFEGIVDPAEIIKISHLCRVPDPLVRYLPYRGSIEALYHELSEADEARLIEFAIQEAVLGDVDYIGSICLELAAFKSSKLSALQDFMVSEGLYEPEIVFKGAGVEVTRVLLDRLEHCALEDRVGILIALAWAGGENIVRSFSGWIDRPPVWAKTLHSPVGSYSQLAGWEVMPSGVRRNLYFDQCYPLLPNRGDMVDAKLLTFVPSGCECQWCGRLLVNLIEIELSNNFFDFLGLRGDKLRLATCLACACYAGPLYMEFDTEGNVTWSGFNEPRDCLPDDWEQPLRNCLVLSERARPVDYAASVYLPTSFSQLGGMPTWIQDCAYPNCPSCNETMMFLAQMEMGEVERHGEGTYYMYICRGCRISATNYQQT